MTSRSKRISRMLDVVVNFLNSDGYTSKERDGVVRVFHCNRDVKVSHFNFFSTYPINIYLMHFEIVRQKEDFKYILLNSRLYALFRQRRYSSFMRNLIFSMHWMQITFVSNLNKFQVSSYFIHFLYLLFYDALYFLYLTSLVNLRSLSLSFPHSRNM